MTSSLALAFDIGGTSTRAALVDGHRVVERLRIPTPVGDLTDSLLSLGVELAGLARSPLSGVGVGVPEYVHRGRVLSHEVVAWNAALPKLLADRLAAPVVVESDVRCGAIAEWSAGAPESMLYLSWGTGLSTALVLPDGTVWEGHGGRAIAFGERLEHVNGVPTSLEQVASGLGVAARSRDIGEPAALREAGQLVGQALLDLARVLDPARVVVGGGLGTASTVAIHTVESIWSDAATMMPLTVAAFGPDSGLIGAGLVATRHDV